jgi:hypothetical protein
MFYQCCHGVKRVLALSCPQCRCRLMRFTLSTHCNGDGMCVYTPRTREKPSSDSFMWHTSRHARLHEVSPHRLNLIYSELGSRNGFCPVKPQWDAELQALIVHAFITLIGHCVHYLAPDVASSPNPCLRELRLCLALQLLCLALGLASLRQPSVSLWK